jgi:GNAT superfamily N-acetyltransferase
LEVTTATVRIRRSTVRDTEAMLEITRPVWGGHDYLPRVWDDWLRDGAGYPATLEVDGAVSGFQHVQVQEDGTGWIEGIRVREDTQSRGLGLALLHDGVRWAQENNLPRVRLCTYAGNPASNRIASKAGLREAARVQILSADAETDNEPVGIRIALPSELDEVDAFITATSGSGSLYTEGWTAYSLDRRRLRMLLATQAVMVVGNDEIDGVAIATATVEHSSLRLGYISGSERSVRVLARAAIAVAGRVGFDRAVCYAPVTNEVRGVLEAAGYIWRDRDEMVLYELEFPG